MQDRQAPAETVLVAPADVRAGLSVTRSLVAAGYRVVPLVANRGSAECFSRYFRGRTLVAPNPGKRPGEFAEFLVGYLRTHDVDAVVPITDASLAAADLIRSRLPPRTVLAAPAPRAVKSVLDKEENVRIAKKLGIPHPLTVPVASERDIAPAVVRLGFPLVVKRGKQGEPVPRFLANFTMEIVRNEDELRALLGRLWSCGMKPQVQQFVAGDMHVICCFMARGRLVAAHEYTSLRRTKHSGILREILAPNPACLEHTEKMLRSIGWEGVACVQFLIDERNSQECYLETNGRFWASVQGSIHAGWNFPLWAVDYFLHGVVPSPPPIRVGSRTCDHASDLDALIEYLTGGPSPVLGRRPTRSAAVMEYLAAFGLGTHGDVFRWSDPMPSIVDHATKLGRRVRSVGRKPRTRLLNPRQRE